jgi:hypothetical protein
MPSFGRDAQSFEPTEEKPMYKMLLQLDTDKFANTFDRVTAYEAGVDHVLSYGGVAIEDVQGLLHGLMFTRTAEERRQTAVFIGGRRVDMCEQVLSEAQRAMFDPFCLSVMLDSNGCNTASAAAVVLLGRHMEVRDANIVLLSGIGPVGLRIARLLARQGANVLATNLPRDLYHGRWDEQRARHDLGLARVEGDEAGFKIQAVETSAAFDELMEWADAVLATGPAGVQLLCAEQWQNHPNLKALIDLNVAPPFGIEGLDPHWRGKHVDGRILYGGLGVGPFKLRVHKASIMSLFDCIQILNLEGIYELACTLK